MRKAHLAGVAGLALLCALSLQAQTVFTLPGAFGGDSTVNAFGLSPFSQAGVFTANSGAFQVVASADGNKFYILSNSASNTVLVSGTAFSNVQTVASFSSGASAAALTPDGKRLLVASGNLQVINTQSDSLAAPGGIIVGGTAVDVAIRADSARAFVLVNAGGSYRLVEVNLTNLQVVNSLPLAGQATGVSIGPNGLVYVPATNQLLEIDPETNLVRNTISVNGLPGKVSFTPDGQIALAPNLTPITGSAIMIFNLLFKTLSATISTAAIPVSATLSNLYPVSNDRVFAYAPNALTLYDVSLSALTATTFQFALPGSVTAAAISSDIAGGPHAITHYLFTTAGNILSQFDLAANLLVGQLAFTGTSGAISVATPANIAGTPAGILTYGDQQTVPLGGTSAPLVLRVIDAQGNPVPGVGVTFSTNSAGVTLQTTSATTNNDGLAFTTATVPNQPESVIVSVSTNVGFSTVFSLVAGTGSGGGPGPTGGLTIVSGQGGLIREATSTLSGGSTMTVKFADGDGNPVAGASITFTLTAGNGILECPLNSSFSSCVQSLNTMTVVTDIDGTAQADYLSSFINPVVSFDQATISATGPSGSSVTFYVTAVSSSSLPNASLVAPDAGTILSGNAGQSIEGAIQVRITAGNGQGISNVSLRILNPPDPTTGPSGTCAGTFALSDVNGLASCDLNLGGKVGNAQLTAEAGYAFDFGPFAVAVAPGAAAKVNILQGNNQSGKPGQLLPLALLVRVTDAFDNVLANTPVSWTVVTPGAVTLSQVSSATDSQGHASALATVGSFSGTAQINVTAGSASATFTITVSVPINGLQIVSGNSQSAGLNAAFTNPLVVKVADAQGQPVQNVQVTFTITSGSASLSNANPTTGADGAASTSVTAGNTAGAVVITASAAGFSATFNLTVIPPGPSNLVFLNGASFQSGISPGAIVTIQGFGIAPGIQGVVTPNNILGPLPFSLAGDSVKFNSFQAPIFSVSNVNGVQQITVQVPYELAGSSVAQVTVTVSGGGSATVSVNLQPYAPGVFETNVFGLQHQAVAIRPDGSYVSPTNPAHQGEIIIIFLTGLGQTTPATGTNQSGVPGQNVAAHVIVGLNDAGVPLISAQSVVGLVGVAAVSFQVPNGAAAGPAQPLGFIVVDAQGNFVFGQSTVIPIQ